MKKYAITMKKEAINLNKNKKEYMGESRGKQREGENVVVIISKLKKKC